VLLVKKTHYLEELQSTAEIAGLCTKFDLKKGNASGQTWIEPWLSA
jgi:hypothetical protein